jgi:hypothetical protein
MRVAVDVTPLLGRVTGVGQSVRGLLGALPGAAPDVSVVEWELTRRAMPVPPYSPSSCIRASSLLRTRKACVQYDVPSSTPGKASKI